jgi:hypothetical protein
MFKSSFTVVTLCCALLSACASPPQVRYPLISGTQPQPTLPFNTPVIITDICPKAHEKLPPRGNFHRTKDSNNQVVLKWICADLPSSIFRAANERALLLRETISLDSYNQFLTDGRVDELTLAKIRSAQTHPSRYIIFLKLEGFAYTELYSNSSHYTISTFVFDSDTKRIVFSYTNLRGITGTSYEDNNKLYTQLVNKTLQITVGTESLQAR